MGQEVVVLQDITQTNPIRDLATEVVVPVPGNQSPVSWQTTQYLLGSHEASLLRTWVPPWQIDPARTPDEEQVSGVVDAVPVHGDVTGSVTG